MTTPDSSESSVWKNFSEERMGVMRTSFRANHPTRAFTDDLIREEFGDRHFRWLDIGIVGMVDYERLSEELDFAFTGVDISQPIIEDSEKYLKKDRDRLLLWNVDEPLKQAESGLASSSFDLITARHVLNHCKYYELPLTNIHHLLDDNGICVINLHLNLIDGNDDLNAMNDLWDDPGVVIGNSYNKDKFLNFLAQNFQVERFIRFDDNYKINDVIVARKLPANVKSLRLPEMELRQAPKSLKSKLSGKLPPAIKNRLRGLVTRS